MSKLLIIKQTEIWEQYFNQQFQFWRTLIHLHYNENPVIKCEENILSFTTGYHSRNAHREGPRFDAPTTWYDGV